MKSAFHNQKQFQVSGTQPDLFIYSPDSKVWETTPQDSKEKEFNSFKYFFVTGIIVLLIAITVFISNRNQENDPKEIPSSNLISLFTK